MASEEVMKRADDLGISYQKNISDEKLIKRCDEAETKESPIIVVPKGTAEGVEFKLSKPNTGTYKMGSQSVIRN
jgi:hypothetical protein